MYIYMKKGSELSLTVEPALTIDRARFENVSAEEKGK